MTALVPAAGSGERFGGSRPKQFLTLAGRPLLAWTLDRLREAGVERLVVAVPADLLAEAGSMLGQVPGLSLVAGARTRQGSVAACLRADSGSPEDLILVHDGARPLVAPEDIRATLAAARSADGAILGRPLVDTVKRLIDGAVAGTEDRTGRFRAETPQVFRRGVLAEAFEAARRDGFAGTDESSLVERLPGSRVVAVAARHPNPKLTDEADGEVIEALLALAAARRVVTAG
jgi:2-C-methyl-D-erythritol 4-phosphate cytidylyltransferase